MRMKAAREHIVPLSDRAMQLLGRPTDDGHLFPGAQEGRPLSNMAMLELVRGTIGKGYTVHGFRSAFRDWCRELIRIDLVEAIGDDAAQGAM
jgi:integrase